MSKNLTEYRFLLVPMFLLLIGFAHYNFTPELTIGLFSVGLMIWVVVKIFQLFERKNPSCDGLISNEKRSNQICFRNIKAFIPTVIFGGLLILFSFFIVSKFKEPALILLTGVVSGIVIKMLYHIGRLCCGLKSDSEPPDPLYRHAAFLMNLFLFMFSPVLLTLMNQVLTLALHGVQEAPGQGQAEGYAYIFFATFFLGLFTLAFYLIVAFAFGVTRAIFNSNDSPKNSAL